MFNLLLNVNVKRREVGIIKAGLKRSSGILDAFLKAHNSNGAIVPRVSSLPSIQLVLESREKGPCLTRST